MAFAPGRPSLLDKQQTPPAPTVSSKPASGAQMSAKVLKLVLAGRKLLLADDSITIQKVVDLTFADEGVSVVCVDNGREAIEWLERVHARRRAGGCFHAADERL